MDSSGQTSFSLFRILKQPLIPRTGSRSPVLSATVSRYHIRNIDTGEELDLRDESQEGFADKLIHMTHARTSIKPTLML